MGGEDGDRFFPSFFFAEPRGEVQEELGEKAGVGRGLSGIFPAWGLLAAGAGGRLKEGGPDSIL